MSQLPSDCLNEIFEYLENDIISLNSCLLVNRLWCEISVRILWRSSRCYCSWPYNTLISCLPNESKEILSNNGIIISTPTSKPPIFNYPSFCKVLDIHDVYNKPRKLLKNQQSILPQNLNNNLDIIAKEILKSFAKQIPSLKEL